MGSWSWIAELYARLECLLIRLIDYQYTFWLNHNSTSTELLKIFSLLTDSGKFLTADLEHALPHCTHILYGSARIDPESYKVKSNDKDLDEDSGKMNFKAVTALKKRFPSLQILLSVGNWADDKDGEKNEKYTTLVSNFSFQCDIRLVRDTKIN